MRCFSAGPLGPAGVDLRNGTTMLNQHTLSLPAPRTGCLRLAAEREAEPADRGRRADHVRGDLGYELAEREVPSG